MRSIGGYALGLLTSLLAGCAGGPGMDNMMVPDPSGPGGGGGGSSSSEIHDPEAKFLAGLPAGEEQMKRFCARTHQDRPFRGLCAPQRPTITNIVDLERVVGLFDDEDTPPQFALTSHSTSLVAHTVSSINPRAVIFTVPSRGPTDQANDGSFVADPGFITLGYARGDQFVEIATHDPQKDELHFYVVKFTQACNRQPGGCTPGDLFTPAVERGWTEWTVYEDEDLKNSVFDCRHCHQPDGPGTRKILRMQERRAPWTHWLRNNRNEPGGAALVADFRAAHDKDEDYAGIPGRMLDTPRSDPLVLEALVTNNSLSPQPNEFDTVRIEQEVKQSAPAQPVMNDPPGVSATWQAQYDRFVNGEGIPVPYHDVKVTDPRKLENMIDAYRAVMDGRAPRSSLPDLRDVFLDEALVGMGLRPKPGLDGRGILVQMCARCHNPKLDQNISRARFDVSRLDMLTQAEKDETIVRIMKPADDPLHMPPERTGSLSDEEKRRVIEFLRK